MIKNNRLSGIQGAVAMFALGLSHSVMADDVLQAGEHDFSGVLTTTYQDTNIDNVKADWLFSIDLESQWQFDGFGVYGLAEYSRSVKAGGVADSFGFANADAGTAIDNDGDGRGQISSLYVYGDTDKDGEHGWLFGLVQVTGLIDRSDYANDEVSQFLSLNMLNNLTIAFPDYAIAGMVENKDGFGDFGYRVMVSSSHGIQDSTDENSAIQSYSELLDVGSSDKGLFSGAELLFERENYFANIGVWTNSADDAGADYGMFVGLDYHMDNGGLNIRFGQANAEDGEAERFVGIGYEQQLAGGTFAASYSLTRYNQDVDSVLHHGEFYYRFAAIDKVLYLTPAVQWFEGGGLIDDGVIWGVRAEVWF